MNQDGDLFNRKERKERRQEQLRHISQTRLLTIAVCKLPDLEFVGTKVD
jgi:hypothetical protein